MRVSVIIPAYNAEKTISMCLRALVEQNFPKEKYEIIVVDDGSKDNTKEILKKISMKYPIIKMISQKNKGPAAARNTGAKLAKGNILLFTDADCVPEQNWIKEMVKPFENQEVVGVSGVYGKNLAKHSVLARLIDAEIKEKYSKLLKLNQIDFISTYSAAYKKEFFFKVGGFDENFRKPAGEDTDLSFKIMKFGKLVLNPKARVGHLHRSNLKSYIKQKFATGFWRAFLYKKHPGKFFRHSFTPKKEFVSLSFLGLSVAFFIFTGVSALFKFNNILLYIATGFLIMSMFLSTSFILKQKKDFVLLISSPFILLIRNLCLGFGAFLGFFKNIRLGNQKTNYYQSNFESA